VEEQYEFPAVYILSDGGGGNDPFLHRQSQGMQKYKANGSFKETGHSLVNSSHMYKNIV
jgi:hypothetical protein